MKTETRLKGMETHSVVIAFILSGSSPLKTETRLKGMETQMLLHLPGIYLAIITFENRDPLKGDGNTSGVGPASASVTLMLL